MMPRFNFKTAITIFNAVKNFVFIVLLILFHFASGQEVKVKVVDAVSGEVVQSAIMITGQDSIETDEFGIISITDKPSGEILIKKEGYMPVRFILPEGSGFVIRLEPQDSFEKTDTPFMKGLSRNGKRVGVWSYYDREDELTLKVNHTTGEILYLEKSKGPYVIEENGLWIEKELKSYPRYLGSESELYHVLANNLRYPKRARQRRKDGTIYLVFEVNTDGMAGKFKLYNDIGFGCGEEVLRAFSLVTNAWLPAVDDSGLHASRFILPVKFTISGKKYKKSDNPPVDLPMANWLSEVVITAFGN